MFGSCIVFNISDNDPERVMESTLMKPADDTKVGRIVGTLEGRATIQKDRNGLEERANVSFMKFKESICRVPHHRRMRPLRKYRLGTRCEAAVLKGGWESWQSTSRVPWQQRQASILGFINSIAASYCGKGLFPSTQPF